MFGLKESDLSTIRECLSQYTQVKEAILFGSRAKESHQPGSDVDIALKGQDLGSLITEISGYLNEESPLPFFIDVIDYTTISHLPLKDHIDRVGIVIYP